MVLFGNIGLPLGRIWQLTSGILKLMLHIDFSYTVLQ
jgi:hypothetical protein